MVIIFSKIYISCLPLIKADPFIEGIILYMLLLINSSAIYVSNFDPIIDLEINFSFISISFFFLISANLAEVPVPQGDLSNLPGLIQTVFQPSFWFLLLMNTGSIN